MNDNRMEKGYSILLILFLFLISGCKEGMTPLMEAARTGEEDAVAALISKGVEVDQESQYDWTALMFAAYEGNEAIVALLLQAGANPNHLSKPVPAGFMATRGGYPSTTALREALKEDQEAIALFLLREGADPDPVAFALAGQVGSLPVLTRMMALGVSVDVVGDSSPRSALGQAAAFGQVEAVAWLLDQGANPNLTTPASSALGAAVRSLEMEVVDVLLRRGANPNLVYGRRNETALYEAATRFVYRNDYEANLAMVQRLLDAGADPSHQAKDGETAAEVIRKQRVNTVTYLDREMDPEIRKRHEASLSYKETLLDLLSPDE